MAVDDALHGGQPYAGPLELILAVQAPEGAELLVGIGLVEPCPAKGN